MRTLFDYLSEIKDFRRAQGQRISLAAFLEMVILSGMSGHFGINGISRFFKNNEDFFVERYALNHGVPAQGTIFNNLKMISQEELNKILRHWMNQYINQEEDMWVAIDGKAIGSTVTDKHGSQQNYKSMVSMFSQQMGVVLSSISIENKKEHEGQAARELINILEAKGLTFTMDALHCQKKLLKPSWSQEMTM